MDLESYLFDLVFKSEKNKRDDDNIERDISIIFSFFGLSDNKYPNGQSVGDEFSVTREYIRQRIQEKVKDVITDRERLTFKEYIAHVSKKDLYTFNEIKNELKKNDLNILTMNAFGFNNFLNTFQIEYPYEIYNFEIKKANKKDFKILDDFLIIKKEKIKSIQGLLKQVFTKPGICGLVDLYEIDNINQEISYEKVKYIITQYRSSWTYTENDRFWYTFENRDNVIVNNIGKIRSEIKNCESIKLSEMIYSSIKARSNKYTIPPKNIIC